MSKVEHGLRKNQIIKVRIDSIAAGGQGFSKFDGLSIFVDGGVPGDLAEIELYDIRKDFAHAKIHKLLEHSDMRTEAPCRLYNVCGGCQWQHIAYSAQLQLKTDIVKQVIRHIAGLDPDVVLPALNSPQSFHYRNKVQYPVASPQKSTRILAGYYKEGSHELINIKHCPVQPELLDAIIEDSKAAAENSDIQAFVEKSHSGLLRHIIARYSFSHKEVLLTLVLNTKPESFTALKPQLQYFASEIMREQPAVIGVCVNFNNSRGNRILGEETKLVSGQEFIIEKLVSTHESAPELLKSGLEFTLSPASFFQINSEQAVHLLDLILDAVLQYKQAKNIERIPLILDAYAGVASIAMWVSALAEKVVAVEEVPDAVKNAELIIERNGLTNVEPRCGTVEEIFPQLLAEGMHPEIVILDPPRKGVDRKTLEHVVELCPSRIIYVSCNPATLARDLKILKEAGYETKSVQPVDLFPQTFHVECVAIIDRQVL